MTLTGVVFCAWGEVYSHPFDLRRHIWTAPAKRASLLARAFAAPSSL
ncbi:MAG: hypothetical protein ABI433_01135 [Burkholderiaceae bacterium]